MPGFSGDGGAAGGSVCHRKDPGKPSDADASPILALGAKVRLEKLSTITRWAGHVGAPARALGTRWRAVVDAFDAYRAAASRVDVRASGAAAVAPPSLSFGAGSDEKALGQAMRALGEYTREASLVCRQQNQRLDLLAASALLGRASLDLGTAFVKAGMTAADPALFPGLHAGAGGGAADLGLVFAQAGEDLARLGEGLDMLEALISQDAGQVVARVIASLRPDLGRLCQTAECKASCARGAGPCGVVSRLARHGGLFAALAFEADPARVAAALEAAATPVGGYRRKFVPGSFTVSLGAFPGLTFGGELRSGSYAGRNEAFRTPYFVAPTLTMPVGIDFRERVRHLQPRRVRVRARSGGLSAIRRRAKWKIAGRAAPHGARSGGVAARGLFGSPFTLGAYGVFRPGLRAAESGLGATGAHALQIGLSASVDVTLFDLFTGPAREAE